MRESSARDREKEREIEWGGGIAIKMKKQDGDNSSAWDLDSLSALMRRWVVTRNGKIKNIFILLQNKYKGEKRKPYMLTLETGGILI